MVNINNPPTTVIDANKGIHAHIPKDIPNLSHGAARLVTDCHELHNVIV